jgi:hypothetical protein
VPLLKPVRDLSKASLNLKGPFGVTNLKVCSQKIVPIFLFFLFGPGNLNYDYRKGSFFVADKPLWVILIMGRENFSFLSLRWEI